MSDWRPSRNFTVVKIATGVAIGVIAAGIIGYVVRLWLMYQALEQFEQSTQQAVENLEQTNRLAAERGRAEQAARDRKLREQEAAVRAELAAQQHVEQTRRQAVLDEASKREAGLGQVLQQTAAL